MLKASLTEQYKRSKTDGLSLPCMKLDNQYPQHQIPPPSSPIALFSVSLHAVLFKASESLSPDPISLFFFPIHLLLLSNFNCPGKVTVGPHGTKNQFIINVTEGGLQEALGSLIWEVVTESVWSSCFSQAHSEGLYDCM